LTSIIKNNDRFIILKIYIFRGLKNGVEMLELDCHITKDHQPVVHHDFSLDRTTGHIGYIRDIEYKVSKKQLRMKNIK